MWPHEISWLYEWQTLAAAFILLWLATRFVRNRNQETRLVMDGLMKGLVPLLAVLAALVLLLADPGVERWRRVAFYGYYGLCAVFVLIPVLSGIVNLRNLRRVLQRMNRPSPADLRRRRDIPGLVAAVRAPRWGVREKRLLRTIWDVNSEEWKEALDALIDLGELPALFREYERRGEWSACTGLLRYLGEFRSLAIPEVFPVAVAAENETIRRFALERLAAASPELLAKLKDPEPLVRVLESGPPTEQVLAATTLGKSGGPVAVAALVRAWPTAGPPIRLALLKALRKNRDPQAAPFLVEALQAEDVTMRTAAIEALAENPHPAAVQPLLDLLAARPIHAEAVIRALEAAGDPEAAAAIAPWLDQPATAPVAAQALAQLQWLPPADERGARYLVLQSRWAECVLLGKTAVRPLVDSMQRSMEIPRFKAVMATLRQIAAPEAADLLRQYMVDQNTDEVRHELAQTLAACGPAGIAALVRLAVHSEQPHSAQTARQILAAMAPEAVRPAVVRVFLDGGYRLKPDAWRSLMDKAIVDDLLAEYAHRPPDIRQAILRVALMQNQVRAVAEFFRAPAPEDVDHLLDLLDAEDVSSKTVAAVLQRLPAERVLERLLGQLAAGRPMPEKWLEDLLRAYGPAAVSAILVALGGGDFMTGDNRNVIIHYLVAEATAMELAAALRAAGPPAVAQLLAAVPKLKEERLPVVLEVLRQLPGDVVVAALLAGMEQGVVLPARIELDLLRHFRSESRTRLPDWLARQAPGARVKAAITVLAEDGDEQAAAVILGCISREVGGHGQCRDALAGMGDKAIPALMRALAEGNLAAGGILADMGHQPAVGPLADLLARDGARVDDRCVAALDKLGWSPTDDLAGAWYWAHKKNVEQCRRLGRVAVEPLLALAQTGDEYTKDLVVAELCRLADARALPLLVERLQDSNRHVRRQAAKSIISIYREGGLDDYQKQMVLRARETIAGHTDEPPSHTDHRLHHDKSIFVPSNDCNDSWISHTDIPNPVGYSGVRHKDTRGAHVDQGLNMDFPL
ncbi:MAG: HEAT repeat domain-containing protein [Acidobacteria bacterium]|nr:HEAT repeat domain-containing protein [Acidobacteriota bacterium]